MKTSVMLHISDMHLGISFGYDRPEGLVQAISEAIRTINRDGNFRPSYLVCSGDLGSRGYAPSIAQAKESLLEIAKQLKIDGSRIILCPGNHDVDRAATEEYLRTNPGAVGNGTTDPPTWGGQQFRAYLDAVHGIYGSGTESTVFGGPPRPEEVASPSEIFSLHYYPEDALIVYSINSTVFESHRPADQFGYVGKDQLDRLDQAIDSFKRERGIASLYSLSQVVVVHHPFFAPDDRDPSALRDPRFFMNWLWRHGIDLVLHGHQHYSRTVAIQGRDSHNAERTFVCAGVGSVGAQPKEMIDRRNTLNLIKISGQGFSARYITIRPSEFVRASNSWISHSQDECQYILDASGHEAGEFVRALGLYQGMARLRKTQQDILKGGPVGLEGADAAFETYEEALGKITASGELRATSTLNSQFWGKRLEGKIRRANIEVKDKVGAKKVRRIFFTPVDVKEYIKQIVQRADHERRSLRNEDEWEKVEQINVNLRYLAAQFEMKVLDCSRFTIAVSGFNPMRDELAIYDFKPGSTRIDLFELDEYGQVLKVLVQAGSALEESVRHQFTDAFDKAWGHRSAMDVNEYLTLVADEMQRVESAIGYTSEWLLKFDHLVATDYGTLADESKAVNQYINDFFKKPSRGKPVGKKAIRNNFASHLDVGVCTGRYIQLLKPTALQSTAIDLDCDVQNFIKGRFPDLKFKLGDIRDSEITQTFGPQFDLITCMLGTCCHFGLEKQNRYANRSGFTAAMRNMLGMLRIGGVLILSSWRNDVGNKLLDIYTSNEADRLLKDSPDEGTVRSAVAEVGVCYHVEVLQQTTHLNLYAIESLPIP